jgi:lysophospholipase L1-like esterase
MQYWGTSEEDLLPVETINVGVGGTVVAHWKKWLDILVVPFHPRGILMYVGSNDMTGNKDSKSGDAVAAEIEELITLIHQKLPQTEIYFISVFPTPSRWHVWQDSSRCNQLVAALTAGRPYFHFIDITAALLGPDGRPPEEFFRQDMLHLSPEGYRIWTRIIGPVIKGAFGS